MVSLLRSCIFTYFLKIVMIKNCKYNYELSNLNCIAKEYDNIFEILAIKRKYNMFSQLIKPHYFNSDTQNNTHIIKFDKDICFSTIKKVIYYFPYYTIASGYKKTHQMIINVANQTCEAGGNFLYLI